MGGCRNSNTSCEQCGAEEDSLLAAKFVGKKGTGGQRARESAGLDGGRDAALEKIARKAHIGEELRHGEDSAHGACVIAKCKASRAWRDAVQVDRPWVAGLGHVIELFQSVEKKCDGRMQFCYSNSRYLQGRIYLSILRALECMLSGFEGIMFPCSESCADYPDC